MASLSATSLEPPLSPDTAADAHPASKSVRGFARETEGGGSSATEPQILGGENSRDSPNHGIAGDASSGEKLNVSPVTKRKPPPSQRKPISSRAESGAGREFLTD